MLRPYTERAEPPPPRGNHRAAKTPYPYGANAAATILACSAWCAAG